MTKEEMCGFKQKLEDVTAGITKHVPTGTRTELLIALGNTLQKLDEYYKETSEAAIDKLMKDLCGEAQND